MTVIVVGNHPVLGNGDKIFENIELAEEYEGGLIHFGFENVEIKPLKLGNKQIEILNFKKSLKSTIGGILGAFSKR